MREKSTFTAWKSKEVLSTYHENAFGEVCRRVMDMATKKGRFGDTDKPRLHDQANAKIVSLHFKDNLQNE